MRRKTRHFDRIEKRKHAKTEEMFKLKVISSRIQKLLPKIGIGNCYLDNSSRNRHDVFVTVTYTMKVKNKLLDVTVEHFKKQLSRRASEMK